MSRRTPEETFAEAREAMEPGDWEGVFLRDLRERGHALTESARLPMPPPGPAMLEQSKRHQQLVKA
jgi:hypothetical protein